MIDTNPAHVLGITEALMETGFARLGVLTFENLTPDNDPNAVHIRVVCPFSLSDSHDYAPNARHLAYEIATTILPETTNNDACDVTIRERSSHLHSHADLLSYPDDHSVIIIDAHINDYLT